MELMQILNFVGGAFFGAAVAFFAGRRAVMRILQDAQNCQNSANETLEMAKRMVSLREDSQKKMALEVAGRIAQELRDMGANVEEVNIKVDHQTQEIHAEPKNL